MVNFKERWHALRRRAGGVRPTTTNYCRSARSCKRGSRVLPFVSPSRRSRIEATDQLTQTLHPLKHRGWRNKRQPIRSRDHFIDGIHGSAPDRRHRNSAHQPIESWPFRDQPRRPAFLDPVRLRKLINSQAQTVKGSPVGSEGCSQLVLISGFPIKACNVMGNNARYGGAANRPRGRDQCNEPTVHESEGRAGTRHTAKKNDHDPEERRREDRYACTVLTRNKKPPLQRAFLALNLRERDSNPRSSGHAPDMACLTSTDPRWWKMLQPN